jgi:hypothetical protein
MKPLVLALLIWSAASIAASVAQASLGDSDSSAEADRVAFHGVRNVAVVNGLRVHEITTDSRVIREYVSPAGIVFAVSWKGISHPDLTQLFGGYYQEYIEAERATPKVKGRGEMTVISKNVHAVRAGHMRAVLGKAWIPSLAPPGFDPSQMQ